MFASLILLIALDSTASGRAALPPDIAWASATAEDDRFWIRSEDITTQYYPAQLIVLVHGEHGHNSHAGYKSSVQRIRFFCDGTLQLVALTTTDSQGRRTSEWQGDGAIRPISAASVYHGIEHELCPRLTNAGD